jgi:hypothetical protein
MYSMSGCIGSQKRRECQRLPLRGDASTRSTKGQRQKAETLAGSGQPAPPHGLTLGSASGERYPKWCCVGEHLNTMPLNRGM